MDIWMTTCRRTVQKCTYCGEPITLGEPEVVGKLWRRKQSEGGEARKWVINFRWHGERKRDGQCCWLAQALENLRLNPKPETRGRKAIVLPGDVRKERLKLLQRRARLMQILREITETVPAEELDAEDINRIIRLGSQIEELKELIRPLGGVPKSWESDGQEATAQTEALIS